MRRISECVFIYNSISFFVCVVLCCSWIVVWVKGTNKLSVVGCGFRVLCCFDGNYY